MKFLISLFLLVFSCQAFTKDLDEASCPSFDYSDRFGPIQDQDGHGLCWAFAASALLSEEACLKDSKYCKNNLSPLDVSSCEKTLLHRSEGRSISFGLMCAQERGACNEKDFSFANQGDLLCGVMNKGPRCIHQKLADLYVSYQSRGFGEASCLDKQQISEFTKFTEQFQKILQKSPSRAEITSLEVEVLLKDSKIKSWSDFLYKALKNEQCDKERVDFSHLDRNKLFNVTALNDSMPLEAKVNLVREQLARGKSVGYTFCADRTQSFFAKLLNNPSNECGPHTAVITGMRWNNGRCELNLRNSWGKGASLNGWITAKKLLKHSQGIQQVEIK